MDEAQIQIITKILENPVYLALFFVLAIWTMVWKGLALWRSAHHEQFLWFVALLILNTFGILEIIYLFYFSLPKHQEKT